MSTISPNQITERSSTLPWPDVTPAIELAEVVIDICSTHSFDSQVEMITDVPEWMMPVWNDEVWKMVIDLGLYEADPDNFQWQECTSPTSWARFILFTTIIELVHIFADLSDGDLDTKS